LIARCRKKRDLRLAITLRPSEVFEAYGIPTSTLCEMCNHPDPTRRLPSFLVPGRSGHKGIRLIDHDQLRAWLKNHTGHEAHARLELVS
jgi:hypothetical protein